MAVFNVGAHVTLLPGSIEHSDPANGIQVEFSGKGKLT